MQEPPKERQDSDDFVGKALGGVFSRRESRDPSPLPELESLRGESHGEGFEPAPEFVGDYRVLAELGRGGLGVVYRVVDTELDRELAIKVIAERYRDDPEAIDRFTDEARVSGVLQHPGIVPIHRLGHLADGRRYFTMRVVEGDTLAELLDRRDSETRDLGRFLEIFERVCQTAAYAHSRGVVHGDIKPGNAMVGAFGEVQLIDWGFARSELRAEREPDQKRTISVIGTPAYMAPEQVQGGSIDARTDVFGLGGLLCEILTGEPPYTGVTRSEVLLRASKAWQDETNSRLEAATADPALSDLARRCLSPDAGDRPDDAAVVAGEITAYLARVEERSQSLQLEAAEARARAEGDRRVRRFVIAIAALVVVGSLLALSAFVVWKNDRHRMQLADQAFMAEAMTRASMLEARAEENPTLDPQRWDQAAAAARQAMTFSEQRGLQGDAASRASTLLGELESRQRQAVADAELWDWLMQVASRSFDDLGVVESDAMHLDRFAHYGLDFESDPDEVLAQRIAASAMTRPITLTLDGWAYARRVHAEHFGDSWKKLARVARLADPDPELLRVRLAFANQELDTLRELATDPEVLESGSAISLLALYLSGTDLEAAIQLRREAVLRFPDNFQLIQALSADLTKLPNPPWEEVVRLTAMGVAAQPGSAYALAAHASTLLSAGYPAKATGILEDLRERSPGLARTWDLCGVWAVQTQAFDEVVAAYRRAVEIEPAVSIYRVWLGYGLHQVGELAAAEEELRQTLTLDPDSVPALDRLAQLLSLLGRQEEAEELLRRAVELDPREPEVRSHLAYTLCFSGCLEEAIEQFKVAIDLHAGEEAAHAERGLAISRRLLAQEQVLAELLDGRREVGSIGSLGPVAYLAHARGQSAVALDLFRELKRRGRSFDSATAAFAACAVAVRTDDRGERERALTDAARWMSAHLDQLETLLKTLPESVVDPWMQVRELRIWQLHRGLEPLRQAQDLEPALEFWKRVEDELRRLREQG